MTLKRLSATFYQGRRQTLSERLPDQTVAVLCAGAALPKSADALYDFFGNRNFYYLTGIEQPESILLMRKNGLDVEEHLFVLPYDAMKERWVGKRLTHEEAMEYSGIRNVSDLEALPDVFAQWLEKPMGQLAYDSSDHNKQLCGVLAQLTELNATLNDQTIDLLPDLVAMRAVKDEEEIVALRKACELTRSGIERMLAILEPGKMEYHLWGAFQAGLADQGCLVTAFPSIIASGENALCLHYQTPYDEIKDGDIVQIDVGGVFAGYNGDVSRSAGKWRFSERQLQIYAIIRACQETAFSFTDRALPFLKSMKLAKKQRSVGSLSD